MKNKIENMSRNVAVTSLSSSSSSSSSPSP